MCRSFERPIEKAFGRQVGVHHARLPDRPRAWPAAWPGRGCACSSPASCRRRQSRPAATPPRAWRVGSRLAVGSSRNSICGCTAMARANARRCCWPPDSARAGRRSSPCRPTRCSESTMRCARSRRGTPASHSARRRLLSTLRRIRKGRWKTIACVPAAASTTRRPRWLSKPCKARSSVVLPEPLEPTRATNSPRSMRSETPRNASTSPNCTDTSSNATRLIAPPPAPSRGRGGPGRAARSTRPPRTEAPAPAPAPAAGRPCSFPARWWWS